MNQQLFLAEMGGSLVRDAEPSGDNRHVQAWRKFKGRHHHVWLFMVEQARLAIEQKRRRFSIKGLFEYVRNRMGVELNNNWTAGAARDLCEVLPDLKALIATRGLKEDG